MKQTSLNCEDLEEILQMLALARAELRELYGEAVTQAKYRGDKGSKERSVQYAKSVSDNLKACEARVNDLLAIEEVIARRGRPISNKQAAKSKIIELERVLQRIEEREA